MRLAALRTFLAVAIALGVAGALASEAWADTYRYDALSRLRCVTYASGVMAIYSYDAAGNRTQVAVGTGLTCPV